MFFLPISRSMRMSACCRLCVHHEDAIPAGDEDEESMVYLICDQPPIDGSIIKIELGGDNTTLTLCEVEAYAGEAGHR